MSNEIKQSGAAGGQGGSHESSGGQPVHVPVPIPVPVPVLAQRSWMRTHLWQMQPVRDLLMLAAIVGLVYVGYKIRLVTIPLLLALALAYLFEPLVRRMVRAKWMSRPGAALTIILLAVVMVVVPLTLGAGFAVIKGAALASDVAEDISRVQASIAAPKDDRLRESIDGGGWKAVRDYIVEQDAKEAARTAEREAAIAEGRAPRTDGESEERLRAIGKQGIDWVRANAAQIGERIGASAIGTGATAVGAAIGVVTSVGMLVFSVFLTAFFFFYFVSGWGRLQEFWANLIPERRKGKTIELLGKMDRVIAGFVRGRVTIVGILMVWMTLAYATIGVPAWYILGPIVGALFIVPFIHIIGVPTAMLLMWLEPGSMMFDFQRNWWWIVFSPIAVYLLSQMLDDYVLSPAIQGKNTDMDTPSILFASLAGGALAGIYGLLIAIPVAACIKILVREVVWPRFKAWGQGREQDFLPIERG